MIKYYIKSGNTFAFDTVSENIDNLEYVYLTDCWLIEEEGELTVINRDGFKQKMHVLKDDVIIGAYVGDKLEYIPVRDANFTDLVRCAKQKKCEANRDCDCAKAAN